MCEEREGAVRDEWAELRDKVSEALGIVDRLLEDE
jgi:hypothetical protein